MAVPTVGTSLGRCPLKIQDTFTWEDLSLGYGPAAKQARHIWSINGIPTDSEAHFFEVHMSAFKERGKFTLVVSVLLLPYDFHIYSDTSNLRAVEAPGLAILAIAYLESLLGVPTARRMIRRYGGKILEWLGSVATIYEPEETQ